MLRYRSFSPWTDCASLKLFSAMRRGHVAGMHLGSDVAVDCVLEKGADDRPAPQRSSTAGRREPDGKRADHARRAGELVADRRAVRWCRAAYAGAPSSAQR